MKWRKLKRNQFAWLGLLIFFWILCLVAEVFRYYLTKDSHVIREMATMLVIGVPCIVTLSLITHKTRKISRLMEQFIRRNNLYQSHYVKLEGATAETIEKITYYPCVEYKEEKGKNRFSIRILLDGTMIAERFRDLEQTLADMFRTICIEKIEERGYLTYCFELKPQQQLIIENSDDIISAGENKISLSRDIVWHWKKVPHLLLTGSTGTGKTLLAQYIITCLLKQGVRVIYCDPKKDDNMRFFAKNNSAMVYVTEENDIAKAVRETEEEVRGRERDLEKIGMEEAEFRPIFLMFDELIAFSKISQKKVYEETAKRLATIVVTGRSKMVYAALILQRPDTTFVEGAIRDNLGCRMALGNMTETAYKMCFGSDFAHVKNYRHEIGSGLIFREGVDTKPREFIAPFIEQGALSR